MTTLTMPIDAMHAAAADAARLMKVLANADRLLLLCQLSQGEMCVSELEAALGIRQPTLSQQLGVLRDEALVDTRREGKHIYYRVASAHGARGAAVLYEQFCQAERKAMTIDWTHFTPWASLAGGVLIGIAAAMLVLLNGRIAGISGILGGLLVPRRGDIAWRLAFVAGLLAAPAAMLLIRQRRSRPRIDAGFGTLVARRPAGRHRHALRLGLHQRPRRLRPVAPVAALAGRHARVHGGRLRHRLRREAPPCMNAASPLSPPAWSSASASSSPA